MFEDMRLLFKRENCTYTNILRTDYCLRVLATISGIFRVLLSNLKPIIETMKLRLDVLIFTNVNGKERVYIKGVWKQNNDDNIWTTDSEVTG
jgi:hypothetical protein